MLRNKEEYKSKMIYKEIKNVVVKWEKKEKERKNQKQWKSDCWKGIEYRTAFEKNDQKKEEDIKEKKGSEI